VARTNSFLPVVSAGWSLAARLVCRGVTRRPRGTKRGSDLKPRNLFRAVILKATTDEGLLALPPDSDGSGRRRSGSARRKRERVKHALIHNVAAAIQGIAPDAAEGDAVARGQLLRYMKDFHEMLQPTPDEVKSGGGPVLPKFNRPVKPNAPSVAPAAEEPPAAIYDNEGNPYVDGG
jgi:hypothetical protein